MKLLSLYLKSMNQIINIVVRNYQKKKKKINGKKHIIPRGD